MSRPPCRDARAHRLDSNNTLRSRLPTLPDAVVSAILDDPTSIWRPGSSLSPSDTSLVVEAYIDGFFRLFITLASLTATSFFVCLVLVRKEALDRKDDKDLKAEAKQRVAEKHKSSAQKQERAD